jgi:hypothetical protein
MTNEPILPLPGQIEILWSTNSRGTRSCYCHNIEVSDGCVIGDISDECSRLVHLFIRGATLTPHLGT